jgi:multidrug efflux pump subunit AcrB
LRQDIIVSARLEGRDLGSAMKEIQDKLSQDKWLPPGTIEYGGLYQQQQESFRNLVMVLLAAILLVFTVLLIEFRSFNEPVAIVFGAILAMFGTVAALWITGITLNIVSFLGAIIGVGIVAKNGILMLDFVQQLEADGVDLVEALVRSGHRRLRPVLMTSLAAALGMLPLGLGESAAARKCCGRWPLPSSARCAFPYCCHSSPCWGIFLTPTRLEPIISLDCTGGFYCRLHLDF